MQLQPFQFYFLIYMIFISISCLITLAKTSSTMSDRSGENRHCALFPILRKSILLFSIKYDFLVDVLYQFEDVPFYS